MGQTTVNTLYSMRDAITHIEQAAVTATGRQVCSKRQQLAAVGGSRSRDGARLLAYNTKTMAPVHCLPLSAAQLIMQ